ncbi:MAG: hypothetical protein K0S48_3068 [Ramlibacter sp.]|nr:hypothetical protein [Ramlibacter sp.]
MCVAPGRPVVMARKALRTACGIWSTRSMRVFHLVRGAYSACWSSSVSGNFPRAPTETSDVIPRTGMDDSLASTSPGSR